MALGWSFNSGATESPMGSSSRGHHRWHYGIHCHDALWQGGTGKCPRWLTQTRVVESCKTIVRVGLRLCLRTGSAARMWADLYVILMCCWDTSRNNNASHSVHPRNLQSHTYSCIATPYSFNTGEAWKTHINEHPGEDRNTQVGSIWLAWTLFFPFLSFVFVGPHLQHMEVPRLGIQSELYLPAYTTATATPDLSCICNLHHSSRQRQILNPLIEARDGLCILMDTSQVH